MQNKWVNFGWLFWRMSDRWVFKVKKLFRSIAYIEIRPEINSYHLLDFLSRHLWVNRPDTLGEKRKCYRVKEANVLLGTCTQFGILYSLSLRLFPWLWGCIAQVMASAAYISRNVLFGTSLIGIIRVITAIQIWLSKPHSLLPLSGWVFQIFFTYHLWSEVFVFAYLITHAFE